MKCAALALFSMLITACLDDNVGPPVETAASTSSQLPQYDTFTFGWTASPPLGYATSHRSLDVDLRLRTLVGSALRDKGYVEDDVNPSFLVRVGAGIKHIAPHVPKEPDRLGADANDAITLEGIQIVIYDVGLKTEVWQGLADSVVDPKKAIDDGSLRSEVQAALSAFPVRSITAAYPFRG